MHFLTPLLKGSVPSPTLCIEGRDIPLATTVETAFERVSRNKGLLGRESLANEAALIIAPCSAIHTFAMRFPIDVIFTERSGRIVKLRPALKASRLSVALGAFAVIEMAAGTIDRAGLRVGHTLVIK